MQRTILLQKPSTDAPDEPCLTVLCHCPTNDFPFVIWTWNTAIGPVEEASGGGDYYPPNQLIEAVLAYHERGSLPSKEERSSLIETEHDISGVLDTITRRLTQARAREDAAKEMFVDDEPRHCSICDGIGHGYPGGGPCPLEDRGWEDTFRDEDERRRRGL